VGRRRDAEPRRSRNSTKAERESQADRAGPTRIRTWPKAIDGGPGYGSQTVRSPPQARRSPLRRSPEDLGAMWSAVCATDNPGAAQAGYSLPDPPAALPARKVSSSFTFQTL
jgi:hypothetical protein